MLDPLRFCPIVVMPVRSSVQMKEKPGAAPYDFQVSVQKPVERAADSVKGNLKGIAPHCNALSDCSICISHERVSTTGGAGAAARGSSNSSAAISVPASAHSAGSPSRNANLST